MAHVAPSIHRRRRSPAWLVAPLLAFALVALLVGFLAKNSEPGPKHYFELFFSDPIHMKVWLASAAAALAVFQLFSAAWIFRKLPGAGHGGSTGRTGSRALPSFLLTLPVAYHCIFQLGFQDATTRTMWHSLLGCAFFGAFAAKVLIVRLHNFPGWVLPTAGGLLFAVLIGVWYTSALWFFQQFGVGT